MITKREIIRSAYGTYWLIFMDHIDEDGFISSNDIGLVNDMIEYFGIENLQIKNSVQLPSNLNGVRPKTLEHLNEMVQSGENVIDKADYIYEFTKIGAQCWNSKQKGDLVVLNKEISSNGSVKISITLTKR